MFRLNAILLVAAASLAPIFAQRSFPEPKDEPGYVGCYEMDDILVKPSLAMQYMSNGECRDHCAGQNPPRPIAVLMQETTCYCANYMPRVEAEKVDKCNAKCGGWGEPCGSKNGEYITIWLSGKGTILRRPVTSTSTTKTSEPTSAPVTSSAVPTKDEEKKEEEKGGMSKAAAAAAAVVSILVVAALAVGGFIFYRRHQRMKIEEEYRRTLAARDFTKKNELDHRLEPVMLQRRLSDGSIADNEDYSRRILKVTNPDG